MYHPTDSITIKSYQNLDENILNRDFPYFLNRIQNYNTHVHHICRSLPSIFGIIILLLILCPFYLPWYLSLLFVFLVRIAHYISFFPHFPPVEHTLKVLCIVPSIVSERQCIVDLSQPFIASLSSTTADDGTILNSFSYMRLCSMH